MKKFLLSMALATATLAAGAFNMATMPVLNETQLGENLNAKKATPEMVNRLADQAVAAKGLKRLTTPVTKASDLVGGYTYDYEMASSIAEDPSTVSGTAYSNPVVIYDADDEAGTVKIAGMYDAAITATLDMTTYSVPTFTLDTKTDVCYAGITVSGNDVELTCSMMGLFYYEGDDTYEAGLYYTDALAFVVDDEIIWATNVWITRIISTILTESPEGMDYTDFVGYYLTPVWMPGATMTSSDAVNGLSTYHFDNYNLDLSYPSLITEDENFVVSATNFAGLSENPLHFALSGAHTWIADHPTMSTDGDNSYVFFGLDEELNLIHVTGTGTDNELTFDCAWTALDTLTYSWYGARNPATITLIEGKFAYPEQYYLLGSFNGWDQENPIAMTKGDDGKWTVTQQMDANAEFKLMDINGNWIGAESDGNFIVQQEQVENGTEITLGAGDGYMNLQIPVAGTWTLTIDPETMKLVIAGEWVEPGEEQHVYILGNVGDNDWAPNVGVEMTTVDNNIFTAEVNFKGSDEGYSYFSFTTQLGEDAEDWDAIASYRFGAVSEGDFLVTDEWIGPELTLTYENGQAYQIPGGDYTLTVNLAEMTLVINKKPANIEGDLNGDGNVDVEDLNLVINVILNDGDTTGVVGNPDVNGDSICDIEDVNAIINIILNN